MECSQQMLGLFRRTSAHKANERHGRLSARRNWPRRYGPAKKFDELAPPHYGPPRLRTSIIPGQVNTLRGSAYALSGSEPMSALGHKQTSATLFDHLVGNHQKVSTNCQAKRLSRLQIYRQL